MSLQKLYRIHPQVEGSGGLAQKFPILLDKAGLSDLVKPGDQVAIKMHFGEPGNIRYIRPVFPVLLVEELLKIGAHPFVTDSVVLYKSQRHTAWDYYNSARRNGFTSEVLGCPLVIAGGMGDRSVKVKVPAPLRLQEVGVVPEILDADVLISLAHVTLHLQFPIGGAVKNLGMGCVDTATKKAMHDARGTQPRQLALYEATIDGAAAVLSHYSRKFLGINLLLDVTPDCDCWNRTELPIVPDLGILAGCDPVALDQASYDLFTAAPGYPGSKLEGTAGMPPGGEKVTTIYPKIATEAYFELTRKGGIGSTDYRIEEL